MPRTDRWLRFDDSRPEGHGARPLPARPAASRCRPAGTVSALARDIADTLATPGLSQWLRRHDADPMHMSPAAFAAFVVSEAERAAVLLPAS